MSKSKNSFSNANVIHWARFPFIHHDQLPVAGIYFLSKRYSTSPRYFPLYEKSKNIRIVLFKGSSLPGVDRLIIKLIPIYVDFLRFKFNKYRFFCYFL